jgi:hypothetical protein
MSLLILQILGEGSLERRILEVNRKRVKVVKPGSKTSFPTTEIRGSYAPPFHVSLCQNFISFVFVPWHTVLFQTCSLSWFEGGIHLSFSFSQIGYRL